MKKQIVAIDGGNPAQPHEEYVAELRHEQVDADDFKLRTDWKKGLQKKLGARYEVFNPEMPLRDNARYAEWKIWFEKMIPFLRDGVILIGHSLGAIFLVRYLSENRFPKKISKVMLVAAPYHTRTEKNADEMGGFAFGSDLSLIAGRSEAVYLYHSTDDPVVDFSHLAKFQRTLPTAHARVLTKRSHLWQKEFPEIVKDIKSVR